MWKQSVCAQCIQQVSSKKRFKNWNTWCLHKLILQERILLYSYVTLTCHYQSYSSHQTNFGVWNDFDLSCFLVYIVQLHKLHPYTCRQESLPTHSFLDSTSTGSHLFILLLSQRMKKSANSANSQKISEFKLLPNGSWKHTSSPPAHPYLLSCVKTKEREKLSDKVFYRDKAIS